MPLVVMDNYGANHFSISDFSREFVVWNGLVWRSLVWVEEGGEREIEEDNYSHNYLESLTYYAS
jgi:hypothetical protein